MGLCSSSSNMRAALQDVVLHVVIVVADGWAVQVALLL